MCVYVLSSLFILESNVKHMFIEALLNMSIFGNESEFSMICAPEAEMAVVTEQTLST